MKLNEIVYRVIDTETTGLDPETAGLCEIAYADWHPVEGLIRSWSSLINPGHSIPAEASAVHHLTDEDVEKAPMYGDQLRSQLDWPVLVAHNAPFDAGFLRIKGLWLDTLRLCRHMFPELGKHTNDAIRYSLKLQPLVVKDAASHRAVNDVMVTMAILQHCLLRIPELWPEITTVQELIARIEKPCLLNRVPFGGRPEFKTAEIGLLEWIVKKQAGGSDCIFTAKHEIARRRDGNSPIKIKQITGAVRD